MNGKWFRGGCCACILALVGAGELAPARAAERVRYNRDVLPILAQRCFACHGMDAAKREADLRLDRPAAASLQLPSGARAIVPGNAVQSELLARISTKDEDLRMPPAETGPPLTQSQCLTLRRWIEQGAEYEPHWALVAPRAIEPPSLPGVRHPVDRFIRAALQSAGLKPAPQADAATLIRRATLDLTGLPPTPLEVDAFVHDSRSDAYERVVDRLLGSEHFGERWARWWLDLAHYADSDGYLQDFIRPVAWRYRQWVVEAFNRDLPFDQFTVQQLAGDLLPGATVSQRMATGFLRNTLSNREGGAELEEFRVKQVIDRTATVAVTWLGLSIGCAQCHDHKFDPVSQREFYQLYAFFNNADEVNFDAPLSGEREPRELAKQEYDRRRAELLAPRAAALAKLQAQWEQELLDAEAHPGEDFGWDRALELIGLQWGQNLGEGQLEGLDIIKTPPERRTADQRDRLLDYFLKSPPPALQTQFKELKLQELKQQLDALERSLPPVTRAPGMMRSPRFRDTHVFARGDFRRPGDTVRPDTPAALPPLAAAGESDRLALARWLVRRDHPLVARVTVNRLWQELFGRGLVATSDNFGVRGDRPSHPELLDWLALQFIRDGWSTKAMLRILVTSETYRQSSAVRPELTASDPLNTLLARQARVRLSAEAVRDATLAVSGLLNLNVGGPSVKPAQPASVSKEGFRNSWETSPGADRYRRGLYTFIQRTSPFAQFVTFDFPDTSRACTRRERSNTPLQALNLLDDPVFLEAARSLAGRIFRQSLADDSQRLERAFLLVLARAPRPEESKRLLAYLAEQRVLFASETSSASGLAQDAADADVDPAWIALASVLLNLDEFVTRE